MLGMNENPIEMTIRNFSGSPNGGAPADDNSYGIEFDETIKLYGETYNVTGTIESDTGRDEDEIITVKSVAIQCGCEDYIHLNKRLWEAITGDIVDIIDKQVKR